MQESNEIKELLIEIRDVQKQHLARYTEVTDRSLALQEQAVARQEQMSRLYKIAVVASGGLIIFILVLIFYVMGKMR